MLPWASGSPLPPGHQPGPPPVPGSRHGGEHTCDLWNWQPDGRQEHWLSIHRSEPCALGLCGPPTAAAARGHPGPGGAATGVPAGVRGAASSPPPRGRPPPQITAAPLERAGTSTWSCCYRGWRPRGGSSAGLRSASLGSRVHGLFMEAPYRAGPPPSPGEVQPQPQICPQSGEWPRLTLRRGSLCPSATHALSPQVPGFLVSLPTRAAPQFLGRLCLPPLLFAHPSGCSHGAEG